MQLLHEFLRLCLMLNNVNCICFSLLSGASVAASSFYQGFTKIAHLAAETKGSNKLLGLCHLSYLIHEPQFSHLLRENYAVLSLDCV